MQNGFVRFSKLVSLFNKTIATKLRILLFSKKAAAFCQIKSSANRIVVLGNGPSLKKSLQENTDFFLNNELLCLNHFAISKYYEELKPKYYIAIAHDLFLDDVHEKFVEASNKLFSEIAEKTNWNMKLYMPFEAREYSRWQAPLKTNKNVEIVYFNVTPVEGFKKSRFRQYSRAWGMPRPHNVMIPAIFTSISLGAKEIILIGSDHTWLKDLHVNKQNETMFINEHFYDKEKEQKRFDYKGQSYLNLHEVLATFSTAFESYHILKEYAEYKNIEIINCTPVSFIDAFKRCEIKELK